MEKINCAGDFSVLSKNIFRGHSPRMIDSEIIFVGERNILYCQENVCLRNTSIRFSGNDSIVFLSSNHSDYHITVSIFNNSALYFGENNYFNPRGENMRLVLSEGKNMIFGKGNLFSFGITARNADPHLIYSVDTKKRLNPSKSIFIGDHTWIGQEVLILKGSKIGSGSILGAGSIVANKQIHSNSSWAGNPVKLVKDGIFYTHEVVHAWTEVETKKFEYYNTEEFIYSFKENETLEFDMIDKDITSIQGAKNKLKYLIENVSKKTNKNRFYVAKQNKTK